MKCPNCHFENPQGMNYCGQCGDPLPRRCARCGHISPPGSEFCKECERRLNTEPLPAYAHRSARDYTPPFLVDEVLKQGGAIRGERKEVSVMFVDVAGFTRIGERFDPEDVHEIMNGCFQILGQEIHRAGGTINQYTGDGVMALFGAPIAYEDHYNRACHAALGIRRRMKEYRLAVRKKYGVKFQMRTGLHTGPVGRGRKCPQGGTGPLGARR